MNSFFSKKQTELSFVKRTFNFFTTSLFLAKVLSRSFWSSLKRLLRIKCCNIRMWWQQVSWTLANLPYFCRALELAVRFLTELRILSGLFTFSVTVDCLLWRLGVLAMRLIRLICVTLIASFLRLQVAFSLSFVRPCFLRFAAVEFLKVKKWK